MSGRYRQGGRSSGVAVKRGSTVLGHYSSFSSGTFPELYAGGRYITIMPLFNYISAFQEMCYVNTS